MELPDRCVLLGIDGSDSSLRALAYAAGTARRMNARMLAVPVQPPLPGHLGERSAVEAFLDDQAALAGQLRDEVRTACELLGLRCTFVVVPGDPYAELKRFAAACGADAVVVGAAERAVHRLLPSVATRLIRSAQSPITVVP